MPKVRLELTTPGLQTQCSSHWATRAQKLLLGRSWVYPVGVLHHYIFIISQLRLTSHPRSTVVLLDTETPGTSREILQWGCRRWGSNSQPLDYKPSALAIELQELKSYCWEGVEFIQLVYCIIIYLSFLNWDWLLIREVQWFYWTQKLLVPVETLLPSNSFWALVAQWLEHWVCNLGVASSSLTFGMYLLCE